MQSHRYQHWRHIDCSCLSVRFTRDRVEVLERIINPISDPIHLALFERGIENLASSA
jgi:hypothetical protein